ncbi:PLP-dependent transferase [Hypomontagnella submonticulosa]|nr:PLP-dependent transferase [Hypomontagnella submonticulosa]
MVARPLGDSIALKPHSIDDSSSKDAQDEEKRLSDKFAAHRHLVPLVSQNSDVIFLNAASAPPSNLIVHEAITRYSAEALYEAYPYTKWRGVRESARGLVARCINAEAPSCIAFTRDTTEGLGSFIRSVRFRPGDNVVLIDTEHPNQVYGWLVLRAAGLEVRQVPTIAEAERTDRIDAITAETLRPYVDSRTRAIGISSITFDSGQRNDVAGICAAFRPRGIHVLADITQHVGFAPVDVQALGLSAAAFSLHKGLNAPTGLGALYISPAAFAELGDPIPPIVSMQGVRNMGEDLVAGDGPVDMYPDARRFEHANMSLVGVAAAEAFTRFYLDVLGSEDVEAHLYSLTALLREECERLGIRILGPRERESRAPHICVLDLNSDEWALYLRDPGGARVTTNRLGVRVSFGFYSSVDDVRRFVRVLQLGIARGLQV